MGAIGERETPFILFPACVLSPFFFFFNFFSFLSFSFIRITLKNYEICPSFIFTFYK